MIERKCKVCGNVFKTHPSRIKRGQGKYCSKKCQNIGRKKRTKTVCQKCGKEFETPTYYLKRGQMKYCSPECWHLIMQDKGNPAYKHGKQSGYKHSYRLHVGMCCESCGTDKDINTHHVDENPSNNDYFNLVWLCRSCHSRYHRLKENHSITRINNE